MADLLLEKGLPVQADDAEIKEQLQSVADLKQKIQEVQDRISEIKNINVCSACGSEVSRGERFCGKYGSPMKTVEEVLKPQETGKICASCGTPASDDAAFCTNCGAAL